MISVVQSWDIDDDSSSGGGSANTQMDLNLPSDIDKIEASLYLMMSGYTLSGDPGVTVQIPTFNWQAHRMVDTTRQDFVNVAQATLTQQWTAEGPNYACRWGSSIWKIDNPTPGNGYIRVYVEGSGDAYANFYNYLDHSMAVLVYNHSGVTDTLQQTGYSSTFTLDADIAAPWGSVLLACGCGMENQAGQDPQGLGRIDWTKSTADTSTRVGFARNYYSNILRAGGVPGDGILGVDGEVSDQFITPYAHMACAVTLGSKGIQVPLNF